MIATMSGELAILCLLALAIMAAAAGAAQAIVERAQEAERPRMVAAGRLGPARDELPHRRDDCAGAWQLDAADAVAWCDGCGARLSYDHDPAVLDLALADIRTRRILADLTADLVTSASEVRIVPGLSRRDVLGRSAA